MKHTQKELELYKRLMNFLDDLKPEDISKNPQFPDTINLIRVPQDLCNELKKIVHTSFHPIHSEVKRKILGNFYNHGEYDVLFVLSECGIWIFKVV